MEALMSGKSHSMVKLRGKHPGLFLFSCLVATLAFLLSGCDSDYGSDGGSQGAQEKSHPLGVWWWDSALINDRRYLDFAIQNKVDEIYLCTENFDGETRDFIQRANSNGIGVYLLAGDCTYIEDDAPLQELFSLYRGYQDSVLDTQRFSGVHLDIEPHQRPDFEENRAEILADFLALIVRLQSQMAVEIDIPFWFDDPVPYKGREKPLYQALIDTVDRVFVMSYRDTAEMMYDVAKEEIAYARRVNKSIMLGAELYSEEGDQVSYMEEGKAYLYGQLDLLRNSLDFLRSGVAIHQIATWYNLPD
ncbi:MAG: hypothetical protein LBF63_03155 [Treponema sp.]|jgi:hypothetical protein|nr:hypothetical protein [Treponema sp.]